MAKFYALGTYTEESFQAFIKNPKQDRKAAVNALSSAMGASFSAIAFISTVSNISIVPTPCASTAIFTAATVSKLSASIVAMKS